jgi:hypothetical protein
VWVYEAAALNLLAQRTAEIKLKSDESERNSASLRAVILFMNFSGRFVAAK